MPTHIQITEFVANYLFATVTSFLQLLIPGGAIELHCVWRKSMQSKCALMRCVVARCTQQVESVYLSQHLEWELTLTALKSLPTFGPQRV